MSEYRRRNTKWKGESIPQDTLRSILEHHQRFAVTNGEEGELADLSGADLSEAELDGADLRKARLSFSDLRRANLLNADLRGAWLNYMDLRGVKLIRADLRGAHLSNSNLNGAEVFQVDLRGAHLFDVDLQQAHMTESDFGGAILVKTRLSGANIDGARFLRADLTNAVLSAQPASEEPQLGEAIGVEREEKETAELSGLSEPKGLPDATVAGALFGMANLTGAKLPASLNEFQDALKNVEETSKNARPVFFGMMALCAYALLATATTTDGQLFLNHFQLKLPIIQAEVSVLLFYIAAPLLALLMFVYFQMYLAHLWELMAGLPNVFPDGLPLRRKVYPWMLNLLVEWWQRDKEKKKEGVQEQKDRMGQILARANYPVRFDLFRACVAVLLGWGLVPLTVAAMSYRALVRHDPWFSYALAVLFALSVLVSSAFYERARAAVRSEPIGRRWRISMVVTALAFLLGGVGTKLGLAGMLPLTTANIQLRGVNFEGRVFGDVDLTGAKLSFAKLKGADLRGAILNNVDLHGADMTKADISSWSRRTDLRFAILREADLTRAKLAGVKLEEADLWRANLTKADLGRGDLRGAVLLEADLSGANLEGAKMGRADLKEAKNLTQNQLDQACANQPVKLPEGLKQPPRCN